MGISVRCITVNLKFRDFEDFGLNRENFKVSRKIGPQVSFSSSSINVIVNRCSFVRTSDLFDNYFRHTFSSTQKYVVLWGFGDNKIIFWGIITLYRR